MFFSLKLLRKGDSKHKIKKGCKINDGLPGCDLDVNNFLCDGESHRGDPSNYRD